MGRRRGRRDDQPAAAGRRGWRSDRRHRSREQRLGSGHAGRDRALRLPDRRRYGGRPAGRRRAFAGRARAHVRSSAGHQPRPRTCSGRAARRRPDRQRARPAIGRRRGRDDRAHLPGVRAGARRGDPHRLGGAVRRPGAGRPLGRGRGRHGRDAGAPGAVRGDQRRATADRRRERPRGPADRRDRLPRSRGAAGHAVHGRRRLSAHDPARPVGRRAARNRDPRRGRADPGRAPARARHGLLGLLPLGAETPPRARRRTAAGGARSGGGDRAARVRGRADRRRRHRRPAGRGARLLPRLRAGARAHDGDQPAGRGHAGPGAHGDLRRTAVRPPPADATRRDAAAVAIRGPGGVRGRSP